MPSPVIQVKHTSTWSQRNENTDLANFKPDLLSVLQSHYQAVWGERGICFTLWQDIIPNPNPLPCPNLLCLGTTGFPYLFLFVRHFERGD